MRKLLFSLLLLLLPITLLAQRLDYNTGTGRLKYVHPSQPTNTTVDVATTADLSSVISASLVPINTKISSLTDVVGGHTTNLALLTSQMASKLAITTYTNFTAANADALALKLTISDYSTFTLATTGDLTAIFNTLPLKADTASVSLRLGFAPTLANLAARTEAWVHYDGKPWRRVAGTKTAGQPGVGTMFTVSVNGWHYERWITSGRLSLNHDFGAKGDGSTDNTAAINAALAYMSGTVSSFYGRGVCVLYSEGNIKFDPTAIVWPLTYYNNQIAVRWEVQGSLSPTKKWYIQYPLNLVGLGGDYTGPFAKGAMATVNPPTVGDTTIVIGGGVITASLEWENMTIKARKTAMFADGLVSLVGQSRWENCAFQATSTDSLNRPLIQRNSFWMYYDRCSFLGNPAAADGAKTIYLLDERPSVGGTGLTEFNNCVSAGHGWMLKNTNGTYNGYGAPGSITFFDHIHETLPAGQLLLHAIGGWNGVLLDAVNVADEETTTTLGLCVPYVKNFQLRNADVSRYALNYACPPQSGYDILAHSTPGGQRVSTGLHSAFVHEGKLSGAMLNRVFGSGMAPLIGYAIPGTMTTNIGSLTLTPGQPSYDGSNTAYLVTAPTEQGSSGRHDNVFFSDYTGAVVGDYIIFGALVKADNDTAGVSKFEEGEIMELGIANGTITAPHLIANTNSQTKTTSANYIGGGWSVVHAYVQIASLNSGQTQAAVNIGYHCKPGLRYYIAGTFARVIPASAGLNKADIIKLLQAQASFPQTTGVGVIAAPSHMGIKPGIQPTTTLPSAVSVGKGTIMYDATKDKLVVSNGSNWVSNGDSAATAASLAVKANLASPAFTGTPTAPTAATTATGSQVATLDFVKGVIANTVVSSGTGTSGGVTTGANTFTGTQTINAPLSVSGGISQVAGGSSFATLQGTTGYMNLTGGTMILGDDSGDPYRIRFSGIFSKNNTTNNQYFELNRNNGSGISSLSFYGMYPKLVGTWTGDIYSEFAGFHFNQTIVQADVADATKRLSAIHLQPIWNQTGTSIAPVYGILYNPTITSITGNHIAAQFKSGRLVVGSSVPNTRDLVQVEGSMLSKPHVASANPTTTDLPSGYGIWWKNSTSGLTQFWYNDGGTLISSVALSAANN